MSVRVVAVVDKDGVDEDRELEEQFIITQQWREILEGRMTERNRKRKRRLLHNNVGATSHH